MSFAMLKTWIMVNVYSFLSSFITYIANVMIFFDCKQLCRCTFLLFNILDLLANIYSLSIHPIRDKKTIYILLEHLLYITWAFIIYYLGIYYILLGEVLFSQCNRIPQESYQRIFEHLKEILPDASDKQIQKIIG